jgi:hypothetical protein
LKQKFWPESNQTTKCIIISAHCIPFSKRKDKKKPRKKSFGNKNSCAEDQRKIKGNPFHKKTLQILLFSQ